MRKLSMLDGQEPFDVTRLDAAEPARVVVFAVGAGGNPERHLPLLEALADRGCTVVAPHFERLVSPIPTETQLLLRARRLRLALDSVAHPGLPVAGIGHSLGAAMLLALAGAKGWTFARQRLAIARDDRLDDRLARLALFAPATDFFLAPGALDDVQATILAWAGTNDTITPLRHAELLKDARGAHVEVRVVDGAGHFSFMNTPPPQMPEPLVDRDAFLASLASDVCSFVTA
ncbi:MAG: alpha/beta hydrolase [Proteobacteria bacterium]|nr:alpha/beta hydrolase [Pseudomonadota bacterium]